MEGWSTLVLGMGMGLRHALDADHVLVMCSLTQNERHMGRAVGVAFAWGVGHSLTFLGIGFAVLLLGLKLPPSFEVSIEVCVGATLVVLGAVHLWRNLRVDSRTLGTSLAATGARSLVVGVLHGAAGSAGMALILAATSAGQLWLASTYLVLVAVGTLVGMLAVTALLVHSLGWTRQRRGSLYRVVGTLAALSSVGLGVWMIAGSVL
jgi:nickel/cobalt exporter